MIGIQCWVSLRCTSWFYLFIYLFSLINSGLVSAETLILLFALSFWFCMEGGSNLGPGSLKNPQHQVCAAEWSSLAWPLGRRSLLFRKAAPCLRNAGCDLLSGPAGRSRSSLGKGPSLWWSWEAFTFPRDGISDPWLAARRPGFFVCPLPSLWSIQGQSCRPVSFHLKGGMTPTDLIFSSNATEYLVAGSAHIII